MSGERGGLSEVNFDATDRRMLIEILKSQRTIANILLLQNTNGSANGAADRLIKRIDDILRGIE